MKPPRITIAALKATEPKLRALTVTLPLPPTTNNLYANSPHGGRYPTKAYTAWKKKAAEILCHVQSVETPCMVWIEIRPGKGWRRGCDIFNREKAVTDALVENGVIPGDSWDHVQCGVVTFDPELKVKKDELAQVIVRVTTKLEAVP